jgi:hypothetical protein
MSADNHASAECIGPKPAPIDFVQGVILRQESPFRHSTRLAHVIEFGLSEDRLRRPHSDFAQHLVITRLMRAQRILLLFLLIEGQSDSHGSPS